jgi:hypothetical protein
MQRVRHRRCLRLARRAQEGIGNAKHLRADRERWSGLRRPWPLGVAYLVTRQRVSAFHSENPKAVDKGAHARPRQRHPDDSNAMDHCACRVQALVASPGGQCLSPATLPGPTLWSDAARLSTMFGGVEPRSNRTSSAPSVLTCEGAAKKRRKARRSVCLSLVRKGGFEPPLDCSN